MSELKRPKFRGYYHAHWLYPANVKFYDVLGAFRERETYWPLNSKVSVGDVIYIYLAAPYKQVGFVCGVREVGLEETSVLENVRPFFKETKKGARRSKLFMKLNTNLALQMDKDSALSYQALQKHGLNGMLMGPRKLENDQILLDYIKEKIS